MMDKKMKKNMEAKMSEMERAKEHRNGDPNGGCQPMMSKPMMKKPTKKG